MSKYVCMLQCLQIKQYYNVSLHFNDTMWICRVSSLKQNITYLLNTDLTVSLTGILAIVSPPSATLGSMT